MSYIKRIAVTSFFNDVPRNIFGHDKDKAGASVAQSVY
jgi:hypothetical protein